MSLLLDALKKAAEEKQSQQDRSAETPAPVATTDTADPDQAGVTPSPEPYADEPALELQDITRLEQLDNSPEETDQLLAVEPAPAEPEVDPEIEPYDRPPTILPPDGSKSSNLPKMEGSEAASDLSPEVAKRIFASKTQSNGRRTRLVVLGSVAIVLGLTIVLGLIYYGSQVGGLDNQLTRYRKDAMARSPQPTPLPQRREAAVPASAPVSASARDRAQQGQVAQPTANAEEPVAEASETAEAVEPAAPAVEPVATLSALRGQVGVPEPRPAPSSPPSRPGADAGTGVEQRASRIQVRTSSRVSRADELTVEAYAAYQLGRLDEAEGLYRQVLERRVDDRDAWLGLAAISLRRGDRAAARSIYQRLIELNPKDSSARSALLSMGGGRGSDEETSIKLMLREQPEAAHLHVALGNLYARRGRWPEAQRAYFEAHRLAPANADIALNLAVSLDRLGKREAAGRYYARALAAAGDQNAGFDTEAVQQRLRQLSGRGSGS